jgi:hypothetical protein
MHISASVERGTHSAGGCGDAAARPWQHGKTATELSNSGPRL